LILGFEKANRPFFAMRFLWNQMHILFLRRGIETLCVPIMMGAWIMLSTTTGSVGIVLNVLTNWRNRLSARPQSLKMKILYITCRPVSFDKSVIGSIDPMKEVLS
jgi:hypothetical protein